jgi:hypothetical protein
MMIGLATKREKKTSATGDLIARVRTMLTLLG